jgi:hypothetical protein
MEPNKVSLGRFYFFLAIAVALGQCLLNPLEKLGKFWSDGLISIDTIDNTHGYFILNVGN